ncbi:MAG: AIR synthase related protein, partial [Xanthomonadales bacterium]|nr:AIR synthase related protein [Xanthomonadales bacterium]
GIHKRQEAKPMETHITLAHGNGGRYMRELIAEVFARHLADPGRDCSLNVTLDAAPITLPGALGGGVPYITTDGFIVKPLEFPGGDIGSLAVNGTVNDLAVAGATPHYLALNAFIEEGLEIATLERIVRSLAAAARRAGVQVVAGDTKVLPRGEGGGLYLATTGVGLRPSGVDLGLHRVQPGDAVVVSGPIGDHGIAVLLAREEFEIRGDVRSDCGHVIDLARLAMAVLLAREEFEIRGDVRSDCGHVIDLARLAMGFAGLRFMRDPTRAGLAGVAWEISRHAAVTVRLRQADVPVRDSVQMVCEMLGYDPYYLACEGRVVAVVAAEQAQALVAAWRELPEGAGAALIGAIEAGAPRIVLETAIAGQRILDDLEEDPLPRIC